MKFQHIVSGLVVFCFLFIAVPLYAGEKEEDAMTYRNRVMSGIGSSMGSIGDILKGKVPYKDMMVHYAKALNESTQTITTIFKLDTRGTPKKTRAKGEIWEKWSDFEEKANAVVEASGAFAAAAESGDMGKIGAAMKTLGGTCGDCHKAYREKE